MAEDGDVVFRSGPTAVGTAITVGWAAVAGLISVVVAVMFVALGAAEAMSAARHRRVGPVFGWAALVAAGAGFGVLVVWAVGANTIYKHQSVVVTASQSTGELTYERQRLAGGNIERTVPFVDIVAIEFHYVSGVPGENGRPAQGVVELRDVSGSSWRLIDGTPCAARRLVDGLAEATRLPVDVSDDGRDISSVSNFLTQLRCGTDRTFDADRWPSEVIRALEVPFLWRWPWAVPVVIAQIVLVVTGLVMMARWRSGRSQTRSVIATWVLCASTAVALNVFATMSYGRWPAALALLAMISIRVFTRSGGRGASRHRIDGTAREFGDQAAPTRSRTPAANRAAGTASSASIR